MDKIDHGEKKTRLTMMEKNTLTCRHQQRLNDVGGQVPFGLGDQQRTASRTASGLPPSTGISGLRALPGQQGTSFSFLSFFHVLGQQTFLFAGIRRAIDPCQRFRVGQHLPIFYQKRTNVAISLYVLWIEANNVGRKMEKLLNTMNTMNTILNMMNTKTSFYSIW